MFVLIIYDDFFLTNTMRSTNECYVCMVACCRCSDSL